MGLSSAKGTACKVRRLKTTLGKISAAHNTDEEDASHISKVGRREKGGEKKGKDYVYT